MSELRELYMNSINETLKAAKILAAELYDEAYRLARLVIAKSIPKIQLLRSKAAYSQ